MKFNRIFFFALLALMAVFLTACGAAPASNWPGLATDGTHVFLADGQYVYNVLISDGTEVNAPATADGVAPARFPLKADSSKSFYGAPAITSDGQLVVSSAATGDHTVYSYDPANANIKWTFPGIANPTLAGGLTLNDSVYIPGGDGKLYALNLKGEMLWSFTASAHSLWTSPISDGKQIYLATLDHQVFALGTDGKQVWVFKLDNGAVGAPVISGGILYVGTISGNLYAINTSDGSQKWVKTLDGGIWGSPVTNGDTVFIGTVKGNAGKFYALNAANGQVVWSKDEDGSITAGALIATDQVIYVTEAGRIQSLDMSGAPKWQATIENAKLYTPPFLAGDVILVAPMNAKFLLAAYDKSGAQKWTFSPK